MRLVDGRAGAASVDVAVTLDKFLGDALAPLHQAGVRHGGACAALRHLNAVLKKAAVGGGCSGFQAGIGSLHSGHEPPPSPTHGGMPQIGRAHV